MRRPGAILSADPQTWHYAKPLDPDALTAQYNRFVSLVEASGAEIVWLPDDPSDGLADSVFTYDPSFVFADGAVIMHPGKELRVPEAELHRRFYESNDIPVIGEITSPGLIEGGDCYFLDATTLAVGRGFRTNQEGIDQLRAIVEP
ncbi:MAG: arginine deiminase family protein, partial [Acidimicrobiales bacterium]